VNEWLRVVVGVQEAEPKTQGLGALVEACVQSDWTGVLVLSVKASKPEARNQVLDFRFLRLAQYLESTYRLRRQAAAQRTEYGKDVQPITQAWRTYQYRLL
jgi:hypothetical protein